RVAAEILLQRERGVTNPSRMVLVGDGRAEQGHDPVARVLVHRSLEAVNALCEDGKEAVQDLVPFLGTDLLGEVHRSLHVGEKDGYLLALAFEGTPRREDLLGEMLRGVGPGVAYGRRSGHLGAARLRRHVSRPREGVLFSPRYALHVDQLL